MTELKTLKDIFPCQLECGSDHIIKISELKAEAIKWVKEFETPNNKNYFGTVEDWIKHFFNLTKGDLK